MESNHFLALLVGRKRAEETNDDDDGWAMIIVKWINVHLALLTAKSINVFHRTWD